MQGGEQTQMQLSIACRYVYTTNSRINIFHDAMQITTDCIDA